MRAMSYALFALLLDAAPLDVLHLGRRQAHALQEGLHQVRRQVVRADIAEYAFFRVRPPDRRADCLNDDGVVHRQNLHWKRP